VLIFLAYLFTPWTAINLTGYFFVRRGLYSIKEIFRRAGPWTWPPSGGSSRRKAWSMASTDPAAGRAVPDLIRAGRRFPAAVGEFSRTAVVRAPVQRMPDGPGAPRGSRGIPELLRRRSVIA